MFKKIVSLVLALTLCVSACAILGSCGDDTNNFKAALICLHGDNSTYDKNFIDAFKVACQNKGLKESNYTVVTGIEEGTPCYNEAASFADDGYNIVFADSFGHEPYMIQAAKEFTNVQFCHATGTQAHVEKLDNFGDAFASIYQGRYLAGIAAGLKLLELYDKNSDGIIDDAANAKVGYVGAWPYAEVISGYTSFFLGVREIVPEATMEVRYTNSWYDEAGEKSTALALIDNGCTLISQHADSMGAPTACEERGIPNVAYNGVTGKDTFVIASKINWVPYFEYAIECAMKGEKVAEDWTGTLENGAVEISDLGPAAAAGTADVLATYKAKLISGQVKVFDTSKFTVGGKNLTTYLADVDGDFVGETDVIHDGYFDESGADFRSAPYFDIIIDGITVPKTAN